MNRLLVGAFLCRQAALRLPVPKPEYGHSDIVEVNRKSLIHQLTQNRRAPVVAKHHRMQLDDQLADRLRQTVSQQINFLAFDIHDDGGWPEFDQFVFKDSRIDLDLSFVGSVSDG